MQDKITLSYSHNTFIGRSSKKSVNMIVRSPVPDVPVPEINAGEFIVQRLERHPDRIAIVSIPHNLFIIFKYYISYYISIIRVLEYTLKRVSEIFLFTIGLKCIIGSFSSGF